MAVPTLTSEQRQAALAKAGESRRRRSVELGRLQAGEVPFADLLARAGSDAVLGKTKVSTALRSVPGIGSVTASRLMETARIAENRKLAGLGARQRQALLDALA